MRHPRPAPVGSTALLGSTTLLGSTAVLTALALAGPALAFEPPGGARDVREFACSPSGIPGAGFDDVPGDDIYALETSCLAAYGVTQGTGDGSSYSPKAPVTRSQMARFLVRLVEEGMEIGLDDPDLSDEFDDVRGEPAEARRAIELLDELGITQGTNSDETLFSPQRVVSRGQMAAFLDRLQDFLADGQEDEDGDDLERYPTFDGSTDRFSDDTGGVFEASANAIAGAGVAGGFADGTFLPGRPVTREQMAAFLVRQLDVNTEVDPGLAPPRDNEVFSDGINVAGPTTLVAVQDQGGTTPDVPSDDVRFTFIGLDAGTTYRISLVASGAYARVATDTDTTTETPDDQVVFFDGVTSIGTADPGAQTGVITSVDGVALREPSRTTTTEASGPREAAGFTVTLDSDVAGTLAPFIYPVDPVGYTSFDSFLEVAADRRPVELFGVGPTVTWTAPPA